MNRIFVDTLFIVALVNPKDQYHEQAVRLSKQFENRAFVTTDSVLLEIGNTFSRKFKREAVAMLEEFWTDDEIEIVNLTPQLFERGLALYKRYQDKSWGLVDCISFVVMRDRGIDTALTLDRHFVQAGFRILMH